ncbi:MAG: replication protein C, partial [Methanomicrobium sp.]|nr:replication protein C [Methanomicrobium sp.]
LPLFFAPLSSSEIVAQLTEILEKEGITEDKVDSGTVELIAKVSKGDLRKAIMFLEAFVANGDTDIIDLTNSEVSAIAYALFATMRKKDLKKSCEIAEMIMLEYGLSGRELIAELKNTAKREYNDETLTVILSDTDFSLCTAQNEYLQINAMIARIITEVFDRE